MSTIGAEANADATAEAMEDVWVSNMVRTLVKSQLRQIGFKDTDCLQRIHLVISTHPFNFATPSQKQNTLTQE